MRNPLTFETTAGCALPMMIFYAKIYLLPNTKMLAFEVPQAITSHLPHPHVQSYAGALHPEGEGSCLALADEKSHR